MIGFSYLLGATAVLSVVGIFVSIQYLESAMARNISIGVLISSVIGLGIVLSYTDVIKEMEVTGIESEYITDASGKIVIEGNYKYAPDYKQLTISLENNEVAIPEEQAIATLSPSDSSFKISYTLPSEKNQAKLTIIFKCLSTTIIREVNIIREKDDSEVETEQADSEEDKKESEEDKKEDDKDQVKLPSDGEGKVIENKQASYEVFNAIKGDMIDRFNFEVDKKEENKIESIEIKDNIIYVKLNDVVKSYSKAEKEVISKELGKRVVGLYRGSVTGNSEVKSLPIKVIYPDNSIFGESTVENPVELKLK